MDIDPQFVKTDYRTTSDDKYRILFVGRMTDAKNLGCLLRSLPLINESRDWELLVCGDGEDRDKFTGLAAELGITDRIRMLGFRSDVYSIMQSADLMIHPSWYEGMPNVLLEALAMGVPSIVSDIPAHRNVLGEAPDCVQTFNHASPEELGACINRFMDDPGMALKMVPGARKIASQYSPEAMVLKYKRFYSKML